MTAAAIGTDPPSTSDGDMEVSATWEPAGDIPLGELESTPTTMQSREYGPED